MKYSDLGDLVKSKFQQYVQHPSEQLGQRVVAKFPQYKQKINEEANIISQYGPGVSAGYSMSGQTGNMWGDVNKFLVDRNLPGQQITGYLSEQRQKDPQYQTNLKLSTGQGLTSQEKMYTEAGGMEMIGGLSSPIQSVKTNINTKAISALEDEARKYKSAEEFVKAYGEPVYHGTTEKIVGDFKYPLYTTPKKDYAQVFADSTAASSISKSGKKLSDAPMVHEFAVNPKARVLDITNPQHRKLLEEQYFGKYSMSDKFYPGQNGHLDWTEGENLAEFIDEKKLPFDAIKLDEGGGGLDPQFGSKVIDKGVSYLALNKNALKTKQQLTDIYNQAKGAELMSEAKKYKTTVNLQNPDDVDYLRTIFSDSVVEDIQNGKLTNWRGRNYSDIGRVNIISEAYNKPKLKTKPYKGTMTFYHGTSPDNIEPITTQGFKLGSDLPEDAFRSGGYGKMQKSVSLSSDPQKAGIFTGSGSMGGLIETKIKPNAKIVEATQIEDAIELNDYIDQLKKEGVDAVWIGGGEKELVVINPSVIKTTRSTVFDVINGKKQIEDFYNQAKGTAKNIDVKNSLYLARLSHDRGFMKNNGNIDMESMKTLEDIGRMYFSNATINAIKKKYGVSKYYTALLDELEPLVYSNQ